MDVRLVFSVLLIFLRAALASQNQAVRSLRKPSSSWAAVRDGFFRSERSTIHKITECIFATSEEGYYYFQAEEISEAVCGVYLFADADQVIQVRLGHVDVPCDSGGVVSFFDGWELNRKYFPGGDDHEKSFEERYTEFCGSEREEEVFLTSQNAGMLHHRIPVKGGGFGFHVKFLKNRTPCNILVESAEEFYTLRNYGKDTNCTLIAIFPAEIRLLALDVGVSTPTEETGVFHQCGDRLQIGGSEDLDSSRFVLFQNLCGLDSSPEKSAVVVGCEVSVVRLSSSGRFDNSATFAVSHVDDFEFFDSPSVC